MLPPTARPARPRGGRKDFDDRPTCQRRGGLEPLVQLHAVADPGVVVAAAVESRRVWGPPDVADPGGDELPLSSPGLLVRVSRGARAVYRHDARFGRSEPRSKLVDLFEVAGAC